MNKNTKKVLTTTAVAAAAVTASVTTTSVVHADTVDQAATQTTNDQLKQAEQNVDAQKQNVQSATSADNQAADAVNKAQEDVNTASDAANQASQTATSDAQAVSQASDAVKTAQNQLNTASQAVANRDQAQADLNQAKADQAAIANQNANGQLNSAVSDAQSAVNDAQAQKNTADQQVNAQSAAVQTADSNVNAAQTAADQANADLNNAQQNSNAKQQALSEAQQALDNAKKQGGQTSETSTKKSVADILWIPDNFGTVMKGAFDEGHHLTQEQMNMLNELYTKNVNAFTDNMDDIMSDADYDTTYDLSGRSYNVTDKQGKGTNAQAELEVFAADVLNAFRSKLRMPLLSVSEVLNQFSNYYNDNDRSVTPPANVNPTTITANGQADAAIFNGVSQAYPILGELNTYSMDQLKYNLFLQLMQLAFKDVSQSGVQGDHAATLLGTSVANHNAAYNDQQYLIISLAGDASQPLSSSTMNISTFAPTTATANLLSNYGNYTSKLDINNGSSADLTDLQHKIDQARTELQQAEAAVQQAEATKTAADQKLSDAKQAQSDAQTQYNQAKKALDEANTNVQTTNDKLSQTQSALNDWTAAKKAADQKVADLQKALDNANPAAVDAAQQALTAAQAKLSEAEAKAQDSKKALEDAQAKLADAQKTLDAAKNKKSQTADALAKAQKALTAVQAELDRIKNSQPSTPDQPQTKTDAEQYGDAIQMKPIDVTVNDQLPEPQFVNGFHKVVKTTDSMLVLSASKTDAISLPEGTTASWVDANTVKAHLANAGTYYEDVLVTFPDGSTTTVKEQLNVTAAKTPDQPVTPDKPTQPSDSNKGTDITPSTSTDDHRMTTDTTTPSISAINQSASNATGANTVESVANQINGTNEYMTREEYKAQQNAKKLPQTGNDSNRALSLVGLGLATFATMFGLSKKRNF
ncbi:LPXTG cell wall anchor domain-containing protein [Limosilactobacillus reuteri]|uniref:LPXTG cell wall anchor domain-containing protein n=1 Tax=Limosilactobacillus reuteri TaxID=1598 RepID=UPI001E4B3985|nr:LPXTG cell wall anchor domain-containing protein [Limosilactobacillus reuteri]MCC4435378.1 LPXTG cell wall anchor domain-containing protein [Limosilactobacillus reuteri]MCC4438259.1 LPXTG cell wall anchor domain-containing protein [Limosilactobacillus reuteri]MCC4442474.1 LPXTG cell wall anchor domain-containing protein [Limosilactobacillus reuteri]MCC4443530.1 LPXTG cell wall anchor domain-containing protein [Limosilactobacillus reuteri]MCC4446228.1 LPXTG cell wall anchor domain-containing